MKTTTYLFYLLSLTTLNCSGQTDIPPPTPQPHHYRVVATPHDNMTRHHQSNIITLSESTTVIRPNETSIINCRATYQNLTVNGHLIILGQVTAQNVTITAQGTISMGDNTRLIVNNNMVVNGTISTPVGLARVDANHISFNSPSRTNGLLDVNGIFINNAGFKGEGFIKNGNMHIEPTSCVDEIGTPIYQSLLIIYLTPHPNNPYKLVWTVSDPSKMWAISHFSIQKLNKTTSNWEEFGILYPTDNQTVYTFNLHQTFR